LDQVIDDIPKDIIRSKYWTLIDQIVKVEVLGMIMSLHQEEKCHYAKQPRDSAPGLSRRVVTKPLASYRVCTKPG